MLKSQDILQDITTPKGNWLNSGGKFREIVREYGPRVYEHAYRVLGNVEESEEATQDVFLRIHRSLDAFRGDAKLSTWIWRITLNVCLTRREKVDRSKLLRVTGDPADLHIPAEDREHPEQKVVRREEAEHLARHIANLPPREASVITLFYLQEMSYEEISEILNIPSGSVATALHRGRERLRRKLSGQPQEESHGV